MAFIYFGICYVFRDITAVMAKWLACKRLWFASNSRLRLQFSVQCKVIALPLSMMPFAGPTEFIISIVNAVKMINMPLA